MLAHRLPIIAALVAGGLTIAGFYLHHRISADDATREAPSLDDCVELQVHIAELSQAETLAALEPAKRKLMLEEIAGKAATAENAITAQCLAGERVIVDCMIAALDMAALRACIPR